MPVYEYECSSCQHIWEDIYSVEKMDTPLNDKCPSCGKDEDGNIIRNCFSPPLADPVRLGLIKPPSDFREVLRKIKSNNPHHKYVKDR